MPNFKLKFSRRDGNGRKNKKKEKTKDRENIERRGCCLLVVRHVLHASEDFALLPVRLL